MVERVHRRFKAALVACRSTKSWPSELPLVLLGLKSVPLEASGFCLAPLQHADLAAWPVLVYAGAFTVQVPRRARPPCGPLCSASSGPRLPAPLWQSKISSWRFGRRRTILSVGTESGRLSLLCMMGHARWIFFRLAVGDRGRP